MLSYIPTSSAKKAKTRLKKQKDYSCTTCPLAKYYEHTPVYTDDDLIPFKVIREDAVEKIVVVLIGRPYSSTELLPYNQRELLGEITHRCLPSATKIYLFPVVKCPHTKDPTKNMVKCCEDKLREEIIRANPDAIICLGKSACLPFHLEGQTKDIYNRIYDVLPIKSGDAETRKCKLIATEPLEKVVEDLKLLTPIESAFKQINRQISGEIISRPENYYLIESPEEFKEWVRMHTSDANLKNLVYAFDIETNGRPIHPKTKFDSAHPPKLRCVGFSWKPGYSICVPTEQNEAEYLPLVKQFLESGVKLIGHNVSFDYFFLGLVNNIWAKNIVGDTMLMAYLAQGLMYANLKELASIYTDLGGYETDMKSTPEEIDKDGNIIKTKWEQADMETMPPYNCADCDATLQLFRCFMEQIQGNGMLPAHWIMTNAIKTLGQMEHNGLHVNKEWVEEAKNYMSELVERYRLELKDLCNGKEFDWNSPQEMAHVLYDLFGYSVPEVDETASDEDEKSLPTGDVALSMINTPFTQALRKYRKAFKLLSTYFNGYLSATCLDGCLRAKYNLTGTATGRLSSSGDKNSKDKINFQNLPSGMAPTDPGYEDLHDWKVKKAFTPRIPGWVMVNADHSQLELRMAGALSKEPLFIESYVNGIDMHSRNAKTSFLLKTPDAELSKEIKAPPDSKQFNIELTKSQCKYIKKNYPDRRQAAKTVS